MVERKKGWDFLMPDQLGWLWLPVNLWYDIGLPGRSFSEEYHSDTSKPACWMKALCRILALMTLKIPGSLASAENGGTDYLKVIGVVKNFNFESLVEPDTAYIFCLNWWYFMGYPHCKNFCSEFMPPRITDIEKVWKEFTANNPLPVLFCPTRILSRCIYTGKAECPDGSNLFNTCHFIAVLGLSDWRHSPLNKRTRR